MICVNGDEMKEVGVEMELIETLDCVSEDQDIHANIYMYPLYYTRTKD